MQQCMALHIYLSGHIYNISMNLTDSQGCPAANFNLCIA